MFVFVCVCTCQLQTDGLDVNVPNSDGVTAVMLAVRDVDLFEDLGAHLPWEHKPVEVIKELLGVSAYESTNTCSYLYSRQVALKPFVIEQHADLSIKYVKFTRSAKKYIEICFICLLTSSVI